MTTLNSVPSSLTFDLTLGYSALLGDLPDLTSGDSWIYQTLTVPAGTTTLTLQYWPRSDDSLTYEQQECQIQDNSGGFLAQVFLVDDDTQAWTEVSFDLSSYAGQQVRLFFRVTVDGSDDGSIMYLGPVSVQNGSTELLTNGDFHTGGFSGWTTGGGYAPSISQAEVFGNITQQTLDITASDAEAIPYDVSTDESWLIASGSGTTEDTQSVSVDITGLSEGIYTGNVSLQGHCCSSNSPTRGGIGAISVGSPGAGYVAGETFDIQQTNSSCPCAQATGVINSVDGSGHVTGVHVTSSGDCYLNADTLDTVVSGAGDGTLTVHIDSLTTGNCPDNAVNIPVTFNLTALASFSVTPDSLSYISHEFGFSPAIGDGQANDGTAYAQNLSITSSGNWTLTCSEPWVLFNGQPTLTGSGNANVSVAIRDKITNTGQDLFPVSRYPQFHFVNGTYSANITATDGMTTIVIPVVYTIGLT